LILRHENIVLIIFIWPVYVTLANPEVEASMDNFRKVNLDVDYVKN